MSDQEKENLKEILKSLVVEMFTFGRFMSEQRAKDLVEEIDKL